MKEKNDENSLSELAEKVSDGLKRSYIKLIAFKKKNNTPLVVSKDGKVVLIPADELEMPSE